MPQPYRAALRLTLDCNNRCLFCAQTGADEAAFSFSLPERLAALRAEADELTFTGGEPLLADNLLEAVAAAKAAGFTRLGLQTNGRLLARPEVAEGLVRAGLTDVHLSLHGGEPAVHDFHTGVEGSFAQLLAGMRAARAHGLSVAVTTVLTRSNHRVLAALPRLLSTQGAAGWLVTVPRVAGRAVENFDRLVPRLGLALPFALHAMELARRLNLPAFIRGAPLCALGPYAARALPESPGRAFGAPCEGCAAKEACPGVDPAYLHRFRGDELSPRAPEKAQLAPGEAALARMFVGTGELGTLPPADWPSFAKGASGLISLGMKQAG